MILTPPAVVSALALATVVVGQGPSVPEHLHVTPKHFAVEASFRVTNKTEEALRNVEVYLPIPLDVYQQDVSRLEWRTGGKTVKPEFRTDQYGQRVAIFQARILAPGSKIDCGFRCQVALQPAERQRLFASRTGKLVDLAKGIPEDVRKLYLRNIPGVLDLDDPLIQKKSRELRDQADTVPELLEEIYGFVADNFEYKREKGWDSASVVLKRRNGSCSEFSYVFCALCRNNGIPTRFVGATMFRKKMAKRIPYADRVWHRWVQVYVPGYGWVHMDPTRDRDAGSEYRYFGRQPGPSLVLSHHGGKSRYLGNHYIGGDNQRHGRLSRKRAFLWTPLKGEQQQKPAGKPAQQKAYAEQSVRGNARIFYWGKSDSWGQVTIDYGRPKWNDKFDGLLERLNGRRWRLGQNHWTNLDTNMPLRFGRQRVPPGHYYVTLAKHKENGTTLAFLDPKLVRAQKLDSYHAHKTSGGIVIRVDHDDEVEPLTGQLVMKLSIEDRSKHEAMLTIQFGSHKVEVGFVMEPGPAGPHSMPDTGNKLLRKARDAVAGAEKMVLFALDPNQEDPRPAKDKLFHDYRIRGKVELDSKDKKQLVTMRRAARMFLQGVADEPGLTSDECFEPRHGIRAFAGGTHWDFVICYQCRGFQIFDGKGRQYDSVNIDKRLLPQMNKLFTGLGLKIAK